MYFLRGWDVFSERMGCMLRAWNVYSGRICWVVYL